MGVEVGALAGQLAGGLVASRGRWTEGDAAVTAATTWLGGAAGAFAASGPPGPAGRRRRAAGVLAGGTLGMVTGDRLVASRDFPVGRARAVEAATAAGALAALGAGTSIEYFGGIELDGALPAWTLAGAAAGFAVSYATLLRGTGGGGSGRPAAWNVSLEPGGLLALAAGGKSPPGEAPPPLVAVHVRLP
jgi:hypothetical protein